MDHALRVLSALVTHLTSFARSHDPPLPNLVGIELLNEPVPSGHDDALKAWYTHAFRALRSVLGVTWASPAQPPNSAAQRASAADHLRTVVVGGVQQVRGRWIGGGDDGGSEVVRRRLRTHGRGELVCSFVNRSRGLAGRAGGAKDQRIVGRGHRPCGRENKGGQRTDANGAGGRRGREEVHTWTIHLRPLCFDPLHFASVTIPLSLPVAFALTLAVDDAALPVSLPIPVTLPLAIAVTTVERIGVSASSTRTGANAETYRTGVRCQTQRA
ncbi:hypothetical protein NUW54_g14528 [Trametes sanguinea]|uniref:Uncharacterized protein n=1 Tax=Trametes sanguinea TaxID=158606 RepID=A0ACC1MCR6_9APHY|nr:hypothetical protein NUW54_g14528 [Trametes sanguinea]